MRWEWYEPAKCRYSSPKQRRAISQNTLIIMVTAALHITIRPVCITVGFKFRCCWGNQSVMRPRNSLHKKFGKQNYYEPGGLIVWFSINFHDACHDIPHRRRRTQWDDSIIKMRSFVVRSWGNEQLFSKRYRTRGAIQLLQPCTEPTGLCSYGNQVQKPRGYAVTVARYRTHGAMQLL
jgi:hypothetical protein